MKVVTCQHESMAVYAAAGYARVTGRPGVVAVTSGPGALNALTGLAAASRDELPVLVLSGESDMRNFGRAPLQDGSASGLDLMAMVRPITKFAELALRPERAAVAVDQALSLINQAPYGTAFVSLPINLTHNSVVAARLPSLISRGLEPDTGTCRRIAALLAGATRPAIMLGVGAKRAGLGQLVIEIAETLRIPVFTDIEGKGVFPESHPQSLGVFGVGGRGPAPRYLADPVDVLLTIGCRFDDTSTLGYAEVLRPEQGMLIQLDHDPQRVGRSYAPDVAMCADLGRTLQCIQELLPTLAPHVLLSRDRAIRECRLDFVSPELVRPLESRAPHDPRLVAPRVREVFGPDVVFCCDIGNHMLFTAQNLEVDRPDGFWVSLGLGGMGSGLGTAIGLQLAYGDARQVVCMIGDGGLLMVGNDLATCVRYEIPLVTVVFNDRRLGMVDDGFGELFGRCPDFSTPNVDIVNYARALGMASVRIEVLSEIEAVVQAHAGRPLLLEVPIDPSVKPNNTRLGVLERC